MFHDKPVIGIAGGIGSGKSFVADLFGELGCCVIRADEQVRAAYDDPAVQAILRAWWGSDTFRSDGAIDREMIARKIFGHPEQRQRLEQLLHPLVNTAREQVMTQAVGNPQVKAFVWDTPLLFETGLNRQCDVVVFVDVPLEMRALRVNQSRGWDEAELGRRENLQWPLDKKREISDYVLVNTADAESLRSHVREILSRTLAN